MGMTLGWSHVAEKVRQEETAGVEFGRHDCTTTTYLDVCYDLQTRQRRTRYPLLTRDVQGSTGDCQQELIKDRVRYACLSHDEV